MVLATHYPLTSDLFEDVADFHREVLKLKDVSPRMLSSELAAQRVNFMAEELNEYAQAVEGNDIVGAADALADLVYVALGTAYMMGLPFDEIWKAVQAANMQKVLGTTKRGVELDARKPEGWVGPEEKIRAAIYRAQTQGS